MEALHREGIADAARPSRGRTRRNPMPRRCPPRRSVSNRRPCAAKIGVDRRAA